MPPHRRITLRHMPALDGVRGVAVLGVLVFHAGHLPGGYLGVDAFFVLSGFLITSLLVAERRETGGIGLGGFWSRRARRLLPALFLMLLGVALYARLVASPSELASIRGDSLATLFYVANWHTIFTGGTYFAQFHAPSPLSHTWSLAIEEQFYLVWPLVTLGVLWWRRGSVRALLVISLLLAAASAAWLAWSYHPGADPSRWYLGTDTRAAALLLGAALACVLATRGPSRTPGGRVALEVLAWIAVGWLAWAWWHLGGTSAALYRGGLLACSIAVVAVLAAVTDPRPGPLGAVLSWRPLRWIGLISYGLYLYHWPIDVWLDPQRVGVSGWPLFGLQTTVALAVATGSYLLVEMPIRRGAISGASVRAATPTAVAAVTAVILVSTLGAAPALGAAESHTAPDRLPALRAGPGAGGPTKVMFVGDSVAYFLGRSAQELHEPRVTVLDRARVACTFVPGSDRPVDENGLPLPEVGAPCEESWAGDVSSFRPQVVVVAFAGVAIGKYVFDGRQVTACSPTWDAALRARVAAAVRTLAAGGARVVVLNSAQPSIASLPASEYQRTSCFDADLAAGVRSAPGVSLVDLGAWVEDRGTALAARAGVSLRPDGVHYEGPGGRLAAAWVLDQAVGPAAAPAGGSAVAVPLG